MIIRRLKCKACGRVHHELPDILAPDKRYSSECIVAGSLAPTVRAGRVPILSIEHITKEVIAVFNCLTLQLGLFFSVWAKGQLIQVRQERGLSANEGGRDSFIHYHAGNTLDDILV